MILGKTLYNSLMDCEEFEFKETQKLTFQYKLMKRITKGMFFCKMHPILSREDENNYKAHLLEMDNVTRKINPKEYYIKKEKYRDYFLENFKKITEILNLK